MKRYILPFALLCILSAPGMGAAKGASKKSANKNTLPVTIELGGTGGKKLEKYLRKSLPFSTNCAVPKSCKFILRGTVSSKILRKEDVAGKWVTSDVQAQIFETVHGDASKEKALVEITESQTDSADDLNVARELTLKNLGDLLAEKVSATVAKHK